MLLVLDVGNTNVVIGLYKRDKLIKLWRMKTDKERTADEWGIFIVQLFNYNGIDVIGVKGIIVSSVVPPIMYSLERALYRYFKIRPIIVSTELDIGIEIKIDNPKELGADRIVNAVAVKEKYGCPAIVIDFGTATTYDVITGNGCYIGGLISPGVKISVEALFQQTAKLPKIEIAKTQNVIAHNTVSAIQSGIFYGYVGQVEYIIEKVSREMNEENIKVVATGGLANLISTEAKGIDIVDAELTLDGLKIIYERNMINI